MVSSEIERMIQMTFTDLQAAIPELSPYQIDQISAQVARYMNLSKKSDTVRLFELESVHRVAKNRRSSGTLFL